jgi:hypothetical protein
MDFSIRVKLPGCGTDHSHPLSACIKKAWSYASTPLYLFVALYLINTREWHMQICGDSHFCVNLTCWLLMTFLARRFLSPWWWSDMFFRNVGSYKSHTAWNPGRRHSWSQFCVKWKTRWWTLSIVLTVIRIRELIAVEVTGKQNFHERRWVEKLFFGRALQLPWKQSSITVQSWCTGKRDFMIGSRRISSFCSECIYTTKNSILLALLRLSTDQEYKNMASHR